MLATVMWLLAGVVVNQQPEETAAADTRPSTTGVTSPSPLASPSSVTSPSSVSSPSPGSDRDRILAIIADAHSGKYFSNEFQDTYPKSAEMGMVQGMIWKADGDPTVTVTDPLLACTLSFVETHLTFREAFRQPQSAKRIGIRAGFACLDYITV